MPYIRSIVDRIDFEYFRYDKHTRQRHEYTIEEYLRLTEDERRLNLSYNEILRKIDDGEINPESLGINMYKLFKF